MTLSDLLEHAPISDAAKDVFRLVLPGELTASAAQLAETIGITDRSVFRALAELEGHGLIERESGGGRGKASVLRVKPDADVVFRRLVRDSFSLEKSTEREYTPLSDPAAARRDRVAYCRATGRHRMADRLEGV